MSEENIRHSSFISNKECEYYPCHKMDGEDINCLFCYCPLYHVKDCGGTYTFTEKGIKNCKDCTFPHRKENYVQVIKKIKENLHD